MATSLPGTSEASQKPKTWTQVGVVQKLYIYPVEGCHPKEIVKGLCTARGLAELNDPIKHTFFDRSFVIYNEETKICKTLEDYSHLVCLKMDSVAKQTFNFHLLDDDEVSKRYSIPDAKTAKKTEVIYHGKNIQVFDCGEEIAQFLSPFLLHQPKGIRLGMHSNLKRRDIDDSMLEKSTINLKTVKAKKMHADFSNYLILAQASADEVLFTINNTSIGIENFRPNIILSGEHLTGFPEDTWNWIKINNVVFNNTRLCSHTDTTTISVRTGIKSFRDEPLRNMKPQRLLAKILNTPQEEDIAILGVNAELSIGGVISTGDCVFIGSS